MTTEKQMQSLLKRIDQLEQENSTLKKLLNLHNIPISLPMEPSDNREIKIRNECKSLEAFLREGKMFMLIIGRIKKV